MNGFKIILAHDQGSKLFTAYVAEFPGVVVQDNSKDGIKEKIMFALEDFSTYVDRKRKQEFSFMDQNAVVG